MLIMAGSLGYREANFYVQLLLVGSGPLIVLASLICFVFARSVAEHPVGWALTALFTTATIAAAEAGWGCNLSMVLSGSAAALFVLFAKIWPSRMPATIDNEPKS